MPISISADYHSALWNIPNVDPRTHPAFLNMSSDVEQCFWICDNNYVVENILFKYLSDYG